MVRSQDYYTPKGKSAKDAKTVFHVLQDKVVHVGGSKGRGKPYSTYTLFGMPGR